MFEVKVDVSQALQGLTRIKQGGAALRAPIVEALRVTAQDIRRDAAATIRRRSGGGRQYGRRRASAPGAPPARFTGRLAASLRVRVNARRLAARVIVGAPHAHLLERGTRRMAARPFLGPAEKRHDEKLESRLRIGIERVAARLA